MTTLNPKNKCARCGERLGVSDTGKVTAAYEDEDGEFMVCFGADTLLKDPHCFECAAELSGCTMKDFFAENGLEYEKQWIH